MEEPEDNHSLPKNNESKVETGPTTDLSPVFLNIFCLELQTSLTAEDKEPEILYKYPQNRNSLSGIEGMFVVLSHVLEDITSQPAKCTTLQSDEGLTFRISQYKVGQKLLVFAISKETISCFDVCSLMVGVVQLIQFLYGSLDLAFHHKKCHKKLDKILLSVEDILMQNNEFLVPIFNYIPFLPVPKVIQLRFDEILGSLGFADFSRQNSKPILSHQRKMLNLIGSCLFWEGYLLCNHLSLRNLEDIYFYLKFNQLLEFRTLKSNQQIILWREIFPTEHQTQKATPFGYKEHECRYFLQIAALENKILCILLQAPKVKISTMTKKFTLPHFYIDQLKHLLCELKLVIQDFVKKSEIFTKEKKAFSDSHYSLRQQFASLLKNPSFPLLNLSSPKTLQKDEISNDLGVFNLIIQSPYSSDNVLLHSGIFSPDSNCGIQPKSLYSPFGKPRINKLLPSPNTSMSSNFSKTETLPNIFQTPVYSNLIPIQTLAPSYHGILVILHLQTVQENVTKGIRINGSVRWNSEFIPEFNWYVKTFFSFLFSKFIIFLNCYL